MEKTHVQQGLCIEKPSHGKYPCAAVTLHRETEAWKVLTYSRDFAQRNGGMESTHVQQRLCTDKHSHGKYPCAAERFCTEKPSHGKYPSAAKTLHRET